MQGSQVDETYSTLKCVAVLRRAYRHTCSARSSGAGQRHEDGDFHTQQSPMAASSAAGPQKRCAATEIVMKLQRPVFRAAEGFERCLVSPAGGTFRRILGEHR